MLRAGETARLVHRLDPRSAHILGPVERRRPTVEQQLAAVGRMHSFRFGVELDSTALLDSTAQVVSKM